MCQLSMLILAGASATIGQYGVTFAYKYAAAKNISVFDYSQVLFSGILGFIFFNELPDLQSFNRIYYSYLSRSDFSHKK